MIIDAVTDVFSMSPMGCFYDYKKALVLITQPADSELFLRYFPKGGKKKYKVCAEFRTS